MRLASSGGETYYDSDADFWANFPPMPNQDVYVSSTSLEIPADAGSGGEQVAWRQDAGKLEVWVPLSDEVKVKRDVSVTIGKRTVTLTVVDPTSDDSASATISLEKAELAHPVLADESSWVVADENEVADRWLLVTLVKDSSYMNWVSPIAAGVAAAAATTTATASSEGASPESGDGGGSGGAPAAGGIVIGAGDRDQRVLTAQQLASYQRIVSTPYSSHVDVYLRRSDQDSERCWYVGKVASTSGVSDVAAIEAQAPLIVGHARLLLPSAFGDAPPYVREGAENVLSFWYTPGDSELQVAQDQIPLRALARASSHDRSLMPTSAIDVGFEHESHAPDQKGFYCKRDADGEPLGDPLEVNFAPPSAIPEYRVGDEIEI